MRRNLIRTFSSQMTPANVVTGANSILTLVATGLGIVSVIWIAIVTGLWLYNKSILVGDINDLEDRVDVINASIPEGNGTVFFDDEFTIANGPQPGRKFMFNASLVAMGTKRNYAFPNDDGIVLLDSTFEPVFPEDEFAVVGDADPTTRLEFDLSLIPGSTLRLASWQNKHCTVACLDDINGGGGNATEFLDSQFAILNDPDTTKRAMFDASQIDPLTNRTYAFPNLNGTLALTTGVQTISDKALDNTNSITVVDSNLAIEGTAGGDAALFNANALTGDQTFSFPDLTGTLLLTDGAQTVSDKTIDNSNSITVVDSNLAVEDTAGGDSALFNANALTGDQTFSFPDLTGTFALTDGVQTISDKSLDNTNSITVIDTNLAIENAGGDTASINASGLTTDRTYTLQDKNCTLACLDDITGASQGFFATRSSTQSISDSTFTTVIFNDDSTGINNDPGSNYNSATGIYTVPITGYYDVTCNINWQADATGVRTGFTQIVSGGALIAQDTRQASTTGGASTYNSMPSNHVLLTASDEIRCRVFQTSGGPLSVGTSGSLFSVTFVGAA